MSGKAVQRGRASQCANRSRRGPGRQTRGRASNSFSQASHDRTALEADIGSANTKQSSAKGKIQSTKQAVSRSLRRSPCKQAVSRSLGRSPCKANQAVSRSLGRNPCKANPGCQSKPRPKPLVCKQNTSPIYIYIYIYIYTYTYITQFRINVR